MSASRLVGHGFASIAEVGPRITRRPNPERRTADGLTARERARCRRGVVLGSDASDAVTGTQTRTAAIVAATGAGV